MGSKIFSGFAHGSFKIKWNCIVIPALGCRANQDNFHLKTAGDFTCRNVVWFQTLGKFQLQIFWKTQLKSKYSFMSTKCGILASYLYLDIEQFTIAGV